MVILLRVMIRVRPWEPAAAAVINGRSELAGSGGVSGGRAGSGFSPMCRIIGMYPDPRCIGSVLCSSRCTGLSYIQVQVDPNASGGGGGRKL